jgi:uncharacterized membrane protein
MHALAKTICAFHRLSLAAAYGGSIFAKTGLRPALKKGISDQEERLRVAEIAWKGFNRVNVPAHLIFAGTWLYERKELSKLHLDHKTQTLVAIKDMLVLGSFVTGVANVMVGRRLSREFPNGKPLAGMENRKDEILAKYRRYFKVMGPVHRVLLGGSIAIGPAITFGVIRSSRRGFLTRLLSRVLTK